MADERAIKKAYGEDGERVYHRLSELYVARTLEDIPIYPPPRRHKLVGDYAGCWGICISKNRRIIIKPVHGESDPKEVKDIIIVDVVDYH